MGKVYPVSDLFSALDVYDDHRAEMVEFDIWCANAHVDCDGKTVHSFPVAVAQDHDVIGIDEVARIDVGSSLNLKVFLHGVFKNLVDKVIEKKNGDWTHPCRTPDRNSGGIESPALAATFILAGV